MSATGSSGGAERVVRTTVADIARMHADGQRIATVTAYDYPSARLADDAGIPLVLVGRFPRAGDTGLRDDRPRLARRDGPPHAGGRARDAARARRRRHAVPHLPAGGGRARRRRPLPPGGRCPGGQGRGRPPDRPGHRDAGPQRRAGHGPHRPDPPGDPRIGKVRVQGKDQGPGAGDSWRTRWRWPEAGAFAIVLELIPEQLAGASHRAAPHPHDRHRLGPAVLRPDPAVHRPHGALGRPPPAARPALPPPARVDRRGAARVRDRRRGRLVPGRGGDRPHGRCGLRGGPGRSPLDQPDADVRRYDAIPLDRDL